MDPGFSRICPRAQNHHPSKKEYVVVKIRFSTANIRSEINAIIDQKMKGGNCKHHASRRDSHLHCRCSPLTSHFHRALSNIVSTPAHLYAIYSSATWKIQSNIRASNREPCDYLQTMPLCRDPEASSQSIAPSAKLLLITLIN